MKIAIDISQMCYQGTGVARYVHEMVCHILSLDTKNNYILFASSLRKQEFFHRFFQSLPSDVKKRTTLALFPFPPTVLDLIWNQLHIFPIEWLIGAIDVFWSSDWTQPPLSKALGITTIHDLTIYRFPESFDAKIVAVHKRKLTRSKAVCKAFFCDSEATKADAHHMLGIPTSQLVTIYPGYTL